MSNPGTGDGAWLKSMPGLLILATLLGLLAGGCQTSAVSSGDTSAVGPPLVVGVAASLRPAFEDIARHCQALRPELHASINSAGSQTLRTQLAQGAQMDVLVLAGGEHARALHDQGQLAPPLPLAETRVVAVVRAERQACCRSVSDLARAGRLVLAQPGVPLGDFGEVFLADVGRQAGPSFASDVQAALVSREPSARQVLWRLTSGQADGGIVYLSDLARHGRELVMLPSPRLEAPSVPYLIAPATQSPRGELAKALVQCARGPEAQGILVRHGFSAASGTGGAP